MKTKYLLINLILILSSIGLKAQNNDLNNDTIFVTKKNIIKCEIVAITKQHTYYKINPDKTLKHEYTESMYSINNNPTPNLERFKDNLIACFDLDGICGFVCINGDIVIPAIFENAHNFSEGLACVKVYKNWGYIDITGSWVIQPKYERAESFVNGYARVQFDGKWGVIDKSGNWVIEPQFSRLWDFTKVKE